MSKTIIAVRHFELGGRESLETAATLDLLNVLGFPGYFGSESGVFLCGTRYC